MEASDLRPTLTWVHLLSELKLRPLGEEVERNKGYGRGAGKMPAVPKPTLAPLPAAPGSGHAPGWGTPSETFKPFRFASHLRHD